MARPLGLLALRLGRTDDPRLPGLLTEARTAAVEFGLERFIARADALDVHRAPVVPAHLRVVRALADRAAAAGDHLAAASSPDDDQAQSA